MAEDLPDIYRPCVGIMLINKEGKVFTGQRIDKQGDFWQMPQGGIDDGEETETAAFRELYEETGISEDKAKIIAIDSEWRKYDLPPHLIPKLWNGKYRGQIQRWILFAFLGEDSDIRLDLHKPEFSKWRWQDIQKLPDVIVPFKRKLYKQLVGEFQQAINDYLAENKCA